MDTAARSEKKFRIVQATDGPAYEGLRALWSETFGAELNPPAFIDAFYGNFGDDITGYAVVDENEEVCAALTCHLCGEYEGRPIYASYAICTREDLRGLGLAAMLTAFARDRVTEAGGISVLSPAEPSLMQFYAKLGYEPHFFAAERTAVSPDFDEEEFIECDEFDLDIEGSDPAPVRVELDLQQVSPQEYNRLRETYLARRPHIKPTTAMLRLMQSESMDGCGMYSVNRGDAICIISDADQERVAMAELIPNPALIEFSMDIDEEIAAMIAGHFGAVRAEFITPGDGVCQGMVYGLAPKSANPDNDKPGACYDFCAEPFYGFTIP